MGGNGKGKEGWGGIERGRNVEFHHLLLSNLTTAFHCCYNELSHSDVRVNI